MLAWAGGQGPGGASCYVLPRWAAEASHWLGFLERSWKTSAGPLSTTHPAPAPNECQSLVGPQATSEGEAVGDMVLSKGRFPWSWARVRDWLWAALSAPWQARTRPCFWGKKTQPWRTVVASPKGQHLSSGPAWPRPVTPWPCPLRASRALELEIDSCTTSAISPDPLVPHTHSCLLLCARVLGLLPCWNPNPHGPHYECARTHTHAPSPHSHHRSQSLRQGWPPRATQQPPTSYSPPNVRADLGVSGNRSMGKGLGPTAGMAAREDHSGHNDGQGQPQPQQDHADRGLVALGHDSEAPGGDRGQMDTQMGG